MNRRPRIVRLPSTFCAAAHGRNEKNRFSRQPLAAALRHRHIHDAPPEAVASELPDADCVVLAMNDAGRRHAYPSRVRFEIAEADLGSYQRAADFLNVNQVDVLSVQHEYGIFGGKGGAHVLALLRELRMPIVTTLHTVLSAPSPTQRMVIEELARLSERLVVMSTSGAELLRRVHGISDDQIDLIPHGIPQPRGHATSRRHDIAALQGRGQTRPLASVRRPIQ